MDDSVNDGFADLNATLRRALSPSSVAMIDRLMALEPRRRGGRGFEDLGGRVVHGLTEAAAIEPASERRDIARALIAGLARNAVESTAAARVTPRILERAKDWQRRLFAFLRDEAPDDYAFPNDYFVKDYRYVTALTVPCGAQVIDLDDGVGPKTALLLARQGLGNAIVAWRGRWFRPHTESRYTDEFNEAGWESCYREVAALLALHPHIRGMVATSWFYDPRLSEISPRLAYLRETPINAGARLVAHGTTEFDIRSATATSATRRELYEQGRYTPICCSIIWNREDLIGWAEGEH